MRDSDVLINTLWSEKKVVIETGYGEKFEAIFSRPHGFFDIVLSTPQEKVGFITLKHEKGGLYYIVNDTRLNPHPTFENNPGDGLEVKQKFRKRSIGAALLSLGIGVVQRDYKLMKEEEQFHVVASKMTYSGMGCYQNFGFHIDEGMWITSGTYYDLEHVPEIAIRKRKVSFWGRLKKRLRLSA